MRDTCRSRTLLETLCSNAAPAEARTRLLDWPPFGALSSRLPWVRGSNPLGSTGRNLPLNQPAIFKFFPFLFVFPRWPGGRIDFGIRCATAFLALISGECCDVAVAVIIATIIIRRGYQVALMRSSIVFQGTLTVICAPPSFSGAGEGK